MVFSNGVTLGTLTTLQCGLRAQEWLANTKWTHWYFWKWTGTLVMGSSLHRMMWSVSTLQQKGGQVLDQIFSRFLSLSQKFCPCLFLAFLLLLCCKIGVKMLKIQIGEESQGNYVTRKPERLGIHSGECILLPYTVPEVLPNQFLYLGPVFIACFPPPNGQGSTLLSIKATG